MTRALWNKTFGEARLLLVLSVVLLFGFNWVFVWITSMVQLGPLKAFLDSLPQNITSALGAPIDQIATTAGRTSLAYVDMVVLFISATWAVSRGSDVVSGEIGRGTMEMLLAQPIHRLQLLTTNAVVTIGGAALLATAVFCGTAVGVTLVKIEEPVSIWYFLPAATNLFFLMFFLAGVSTLMSAWDSYRWRTIGIMGGFYVASMIFKVLSRTVPPLEWLRYFSFMCAYEPQVLVTAMINGDPVLPTLLVYVAILGGLGLLAYIAAAVVFLRRDLPAPL